MYFVGTRRVARGSQDSPGSEGGAEFCAAGGMVSSGAPAAWAFPFSENVNLNGAWTLLHPTHYRSFSHILTPAAVPSPTAPPAPAPVAAAAAHPRMPLTR